MGSCHEEGARDWNRAGIELPIPREARDRQLRFQLDSGRPPGDMSSSENGHSYNEIDDVVGNFGETKAGRVGGIKLVG
eukprot:gene3985-biopygen12338